MRNLACVICLLVVGACEAEGGARRLDGAAVPGATRSAAVMEDGADATTGTGADGAAERGPGVEVALVGTGGVVMVAPGTGGATTASSKRTGAGGNIGTGGVSGTGGAAGTVATASDAGTERADAGYRNDAGWSPYLPDGGENLCCMPCTEYDGCVVQVHTTPFCRAGANCYKGDGLGGVWPQCRQCAP